ncbi:MAG TPA: CorA family divalent cation transporter [Bauldia sp.]|nr:CorA family divalent cation transporter [Bauldia sp.]
MAPGVLPGLVFAFRVHADGLAIELPADKPIDLAAVSGAWLWLHFNLADKRAGQWISGSASLPVAARALVVALHDHQQLYTTGDCVYGVVSDLVRALDRAVEETAFLNFAMTERLVVTGRRQSLQSVEAVRAAMAGGRRVANAAALIEAIVERATAGIDGLLENLGKELDRIEDLVLIDSVPDERQRVARVRRTVVRLHRQVVSLRVLLDRFEASDEEARTPALEIATDRLVQRLDALDQEVIAAQERARLLQDEIGARLSEESARNLNALSVLTALFLPATLVTGIFGMNTTALPFSHSAHGSAWAIALGAVAAAATYFILRWIGVIRR